MKKLPSYAELNDNLGNTRLAVYIKTLTILENYIKGETLEINNDINFINSQLECTIKESTILITILSTTFDTLQDYLSDLQEYPKRELTSITDLQHYGFKLQEASIYLKRIADEYDLLKDIIRRLNKIDETLNIKGIYLKEVEICDLTTKQDNLCSIAKQVQEDFNHCVYLYSVLGPIIKRWSSRIVDNMKINESKLNLGFIPFDETALNLGDIAIPELI